MLTRDECVAVLQDGGLPTAGQVSYHLLWYASQVGVLCQGPPRGKDHTFTLLAEWVPSPATPSREEALAIMALRYFRSHGPASEKDFARWTGLGLRECRVGIAEAGDALVRVDTSAGPMLAAAAVLDVNSTASVRTWFCPGSTSSCWATATARCSWNQSTSRPSCLVTMGCFQSTLVKDGLTVGIWKRSLKAKTVDIAVTPLVKIAAADRKAFEREFAAYGAFVGREPRVSWS